MSRRITGISLFGIEGWRFLELADTAYSLFCVSFYGPNEYLSYKESPCMSEPKDQTITLKVCLKPSESSVQPRATNYMNVGLAQGIAYVDLGSSIPRCSQPSPRPPRMVRPHRRGWSAPLSPAWPWGWMCWRGRINRFSKSYSCSLSR